MKNSRENRKKMAKLKEILAPKLKKIAKTQVFGKSACVHGPPDCEKKKPGLLANSPTLLPDSTPRLPN